MMCSRALVPSVPIIFAALDCSEMYRHDTTIVLLSSWVPEKLLIDVDAVGIIVSDRSILLIDLIDERVRGTTRLQSLLDS